MPYVINRHHFTSNYLKLAGIRREQLEQKS